MTHRVVSDYTGQASGSGNVKVFVRARPPDEAADTSFLEVADDTKIITIKDPDASSKKYSEVAFQFDRVFWTGVKQKEIFEETCVPLVDHVIEGFNCCCFAYGQTGSGKTYTMFGEEGEIRGMIPRSVEYLFEVLSKRSSTNEIAMVCTFLEIYNDAIRDLGKSYLVAMGAESSTSAALHMKTSDLFASLSGKRGNAFYAPAFKRQHQQLASKNFAGMPALKEAADEYEAMNCEIREDMDGNVFVKDLSLVPVTTMDEVMSLIASGLRVRATHETKMNAVSSRSHTVFTVTVVQKDKVSQQAVSGMLNLVDLAGSERLKKSESVGVRLKEALHINTSLTALGKVVMSLDPHSENSHIPYRDSKLTRVLQNSLGGNSHTTLLATMLPVPYHYEECLSTLQFANRCRNVVNNPRVNYVADVEDKDRKIRRLTDELQQARIKVGQLESGGGGMGGMRNTMTPAKLVGILNKLGIKASLGSDGTLVIDGKKIATEGLGIGAEEEESLADTNAGSASSAWEGGRGGTAGASGMGSSGRSRISSEKMRRKFEELEAENKELSEQLASVKVESDAFARQVGSVSAELAKHQTKSKHREFQLNQILAERENFIIEIQKSMKENYGKEMETLIAHNNSRLQQNAQLLEQYPAALKQRAAATKTVQEQTAEIEKQLRGAFEAHLSQLEKSRVAELSNTKQQYEYWLRERDTNLAKFVDGFNRYRAKKSSHLRACEKEIISLYEYTMKLEHILHECEMGKYPIQQRQPGSSGRPTTGLLLNGDKNFTASVLPNQTQSQQQYPYGGVSIPKANKPTNPLTAALQEAVRATSTRSAPSSRSGADKKSGNLGHLELSKRFIHKHIERQNKMQNARGGENAINEMLAQNPDDATDNELQDHVLKLLSMAAGGRDVLPVPSGHLGSSRGTVRPRSASATAASATDAAATNAAANAMVAANYGVSTQAVTVKARLPSSNRPSSASATARKATFSQTAPSSSDGTPGVRQITDGAGEAYGYEADRQSFMEEIGILQSEIDSLKKARNAEQMQLEHILEELQSNETWKYMSFLEQEKERMQEQIKDLSLQLHHSKVANGALNRGTTTATMKSR